MKSDNHIISHLTSHTIDLTWSRQFYIISYPKINLFSIICYLIFLTFLVNIYNQSFKSIFANQLFQSIYYIKLVAPLAYDTLPSQI